MKNSLFSIFLLIIATFPTFAQDYSRMKEQADSAYASQNYETALTQYLGISDTVSDANLCYNIGCCYYRLDSISRAVLWFERALLLNPSDDDIRFNLNMARSKTIDRITPKHEMFFVTVFRGITNMCTLQEWAILCIALFAMMLISFSLFLFSTKFVVRKFSFYLSILLAAMVIFGNICAYQQKTISQAHVSGIIMTSAVSVKSTPSESGNDLFVLHEGTRVEVTDDTMKDWCEICIADGKVGWMQRKDMERI